MTLSHPGTLLGAPQAGEPGQHLSTPQGPANSHSRSGWLMRVPQAETQLMEIYRYINYFLPVWDNAARTSPNLAKLCWVPYLPKDGWWACWASKNPPITWKWEWFPLPPLLYLPAPLSQGFQGISGTHPGRHWLEVSELWMERLLEPRRFYREQGDPKSKFRDTGLIHQLSNAILPKFLLCCCLCLTDTVWPQKLELVLHDHRGCNEGEFTPALETGQVNKSSREWDQVEGSARSSSDTVLLQSQPSGVKAAEKRGFVDFIICTHNQAVCCKNNPRLTQPVKNTTKSYSNYSYNGARQDRQIPCVSRYIFIYICFHICIYKYIWNIPCDKVKQLLSTGDRVSLDFPAQRTDGELTNKWKVGRIQRFFSHWKASLWVWIFPLRWE